MADLSQFDLTAQKAASGRVECTLGRQARVFQAAAFEDCNRPRIPHAGRLPGFATASTWFTTQRDREERIRELREQQVAAMDQPPHAA